MPAERVPQLQALLDEVVYRSLKPLCLGLAAICAVLVLIGIYYADGSQAALLITGTDGLIALVFFGMYRIVDERAGPESAHGWGYGIGLIALANAMFAFYLTRSPFLLTYLPVIAIGFGAFLLSVRWLIISLATVLAVSLVGTIATLNVADYLLYAPIMLAACVFSTLILMVRRAGFAYAHEAMVAVQAEVEQREEMELKLAQSQRLDSLGKLVSGIAHDFNNMMMVVIGYSDTLLERSPDETSRDGLTQIRKAGESAASLARKMLAFSRQQVMQPKVVAVNDVVESARGLVSKSLTPDIQLQLNLHPDSGYVEVDPVQIEQVLLNLALNARDAMEPNGGGVLTIATRPGTMSSAESAEVDALAVVLEVEDTGVGMDPELASRVFEPFFTTKTAEKGTGLGLATVHGIIAQSGGTIDIESRKGVGTTFRIELPRVVQTVEKEAGEAADEGLSGYTVLVVDDETEIRDVVANTLQAHGCKTLTAGSAREALDIAAQEAFDVVLTDIVMPEMNGLDLERALQAAGHDYPVIFMSGNSTEVASRAPGVMSKTPFISKPFRARDLVEVLRATLKDRNDASRSDEVA